MNDQLGRRRGRAGWVLPVVAFVVIAGGAALFLMLRSDGRQSMPGGGSSASGSSGTGGGGKTPSEAGQKESFPVKPAASSAEIAELLKLATGDAREQYKGFGGLRRLAKEGLSPEAAKQIVDYAKKLMKSEDKSKLQTGIRLIEVSGDWLCGEMVLAAWTDNRNDADVAGVAEAALVNLLRVREIKIASQTHPEWSPRKQEQQGVRSALSQGLSCGSDPAKWRELWKSVMAESEGAGGGKPVGKPESQSGEAPAGAPADSPPSPSQP